MVVLDRHVAEHPFFRDMDAEQIKVLAGYGSLQSYAPGQYIFKQDDPADWFYTIRSGKVSVEIHTPGTTGVPIQQLGPGEVLGWSWLVEPFRKRFDARVLEPVELVAFDAKALRKRCETDLRLSNALLRRLIKVVGERLQLTRQQLMDVYGVPR